MPGRDAKGRINELYKEILITESFNDMKREEIPQIEVREWELEQNVGRKVIIDATYVAGNFTYIQCKVCKVFSRNCLLWEIL